MGILSRIIGRQSNLPARPAPGAAFFRREPILSGWNPALRESRVDVSTAYRMAAARAVDALQNSGWITGGVNAAVGAIVGNGLQLSAKPDIALFGGNQADRDAWARETEAAFAIYADAPRECDAGGRMRLGQMTAAAVRHWFATGEILSLVTPKRFPGAQYQTKARLLPAWRIPIKNETNANRVDLVDGVYVDDDGAAVAYLIRERTALGVETDRRMRARDATGRPIVIHVFDGVPGTVRGISPLAPVMKVIRQYDQLADATLMTALLQAIFAATIKSPEAPTSAFEALQTEGDASGSAEFQAYMEARQSWYDNTKLNLGEHGRIVHLFPTEELNFHSAKAPHETYDPFSAGLLREIAVCLGVTYEMMTGDHRNANFSSANVGVAVNWPTMLYRRQHIAAPFAGQVYEAWLEEAIATGRRPFPGGLAAFLKNRTSACRARWRGPARPVVDPLKQAKAGEIQINKLGASLESVRSDYGEDWQDEADQKAAESEYYKNLGLPDPHALQAPGASASDEPDDPRDNGE